MSSRVLVVLIVLAGCDERVASKPAVRPAPTAPSSLDVEGDVPPVATALGLGPTATPEQIMALERLAEEVGKFGGQGCGAITLADGTERGFFSNYYQVPFPCRADPQILSFGYVQDGTRRIHSVHGAGFEYRLENGVYVLHRHPTDP